MTNEAHDASASRALSAVLAFTAALTLSACGDNQQALLAAARREASINLAPPGSQRSFRQASDGSGSVVVTTTYQYDGDAGTVFSFFRERLPGLGWRFVRARGEASEGFTKQIKGKTASFYVRPDAAEKSLSTELVISYDPGLFMDM